MLLLLFIQVEAVFEPTSAIDAMQTIKIRASITAYSTAVAPSSLRVNRCRKCNIEVRLKSRKVKQRPRTTCLGKNGVSVTSTVRHAGLLSNEAYSAASPRD
jgi:hypothetical protein